MGDSLPSNVINESRHRLSNGIRVQSSSNITVDNCSMDLPQNRGAGGNGYGFTINSENTLVQNCSAYRNRHGFVNGQAFAQSGTVFSKCHSEGGWSFHYNWMDFWSRYAQLEVGGLGVPGFSDNHFPMTSKQLVTDSDLYDGWASINRHHNSNNVGKTSTNAVFWNNRGAPLEDRVFWDNDNYLYRSDWSKALLPNLK